MHKIWHMYIVHTLYKMHRNKMYKTGLRGMLNGHVVAGKYRKKVLENIVG